MRTQHQTKMQARMVRIAVGVGVVILMIVLATMTAVLLAKAMDAARTDASESRAAYAHEGYYNMSESILGIYKNAAVAVDSAACSSVGKRILRRGGSAVDAAIAAGLCNSAYNAQSMGIGGGFFMVVYNKTTKKAVTIVAREAAPLAANLTMFLNLPSNASKLGGLAIAVPGEIAGYRQAWQLFGRLPWHDLFNDTIDIMENGYPVGKSLWQSMSRFQAAVKASPALSEMLVNPATGEVYKEGETIKNPKLAQTLRIIAANWTEFYEGNLAKTIVEEIQAAGGIITLEDLKSYKARVTDAVSVHLNRDHSQLYSAPPPSSGIILAYIMNILDGYNMGRNSVSTMEKSVLTHHRIIEAFKFAFAARSRLGDPEFVSLKMLMDTMMSDQDAEEIRSRITDSQTHPPEYYGGEFGTQEAQGTAHLSVLSPDGDAVALTSTVNLYFGSGVRGIKTGIIYNDQMDDFSSPGQANFFGLPPSPANFIQPRKRPLSSMCPTIIVDRSGIVRLVGGASGGARIISGMAYVIISNLWFERNIKEAIDMRRLHHQLYPNIVNVEPDFDPRLIEGLKAKGHQLEIGTSTFSVFQGISIARNGTIFANSDYRKGGAPDGY